MSDNIDYDWDKDEQLVIIQKVKLTVDDKTIRRIIDNYLDGVCPFCYNNILNGDKVCCDCLKSIIESHKSCCIKE